MGSDNLFKKRKGTGRKAASRFQKDRVAIICEGTRTEPQYFSGLRRYLRINKVNFDIHRASGGMDPSAIVKAALKYHGKNPDVDRIYCVFDRDEHPHFKGVVDQIHAHARNGIPLVSITSMPCFEIWILLHFEYSTREWCRSGDNSPCDCVIKKLKTYYPNYEKNDSNLFVDTVSKIRDAKTNAERLEAHHKRTGTDNPSTEIHKLIAALQELSRKKLF